MTLTQKEIDALEIAGFNSVTELLKRYFELTRSINSTVKAFDEYTKTLDVYGEDKGKITHD